jgi:putative ABC transport system ATP-binding protein
VAEAAGAAVIELSGVTKVHGGGDVRVDALREIDFTVHEREFVAVMGPSGSGKTTLLGILGLLDRPTSGTYRLVGEEVTGLDEARRARVRRERIGIVFQAYNLLPRATAYENVELPLVYGNVDKRERRRLTLAALAAVGLESRIDHRPASLSGGEQQRVAIARALAVRPDVLLADEPTGSLDSENAEEILRLLDRINRMGTTIVMVTHSSEVAGGASRVLRLADGRVAADNLVEQRLPAQALS